MANQHITAALRCSQFKGNTRLVLLVLADAASPGSPDKDAKMLPKGFCKRKLSTIMAAIHCHRQQTVTKAITELKQAGAIKQRLRKGASPMYYVNLQWLEEHAYTEAELAKFRYPALEVSRKAANQDGLPEGGPQATPESPETGEQRKPANLDNGNRLILETETVVVNQRKPANRFPTFVPPPAEGFVPPAGAVSIPPAEQGTLDRPSDSKTRKPKNQQPPPRKASPSDPSTGTFSDPGPSGRNGRAKAQGVPPRRSAMDDYLSDLTECGHSLCEGEMHCLRQSGSFAVEEDLEI